MRVFINRYKTASKSAKELSTELNRVGVECKLIRSTGSNYQHNPDKDVVINWGSSVCPVYDNMLNLPSSVKRASNKISTFETLSKQGVATVPFFYTKEEAEQFMQGGNGRIVYCRKLVTATQGAGIVVAKNPAELELARLYTGGLTDKARLEFRVHVFKGKVLHTQQKRRRNGYRDNPNFSDEVRNLAGGWIFGIKDVAISQATKDTSIAAVKALWLDFGAVDILQTPNGKGWVLEVNTACGLEGTTIEKYAEAFKDYMVPDELDVLNNEGA